MHVNAATALFLILLFTTNVTLDTAVEIMEDNETTQEGRREGYPWTKALDRKLIEIWLKTDPDKYGHGPRMLEAWLTEFKPDNRINGKILKDRARTIIARTKEVSGLSPINSSILRKRVKWTSAMNLDALKLLESTNMRQNCAEEMYRKWRETHSFNDNVKPRSLYRRAIALRDSGYKVEEQTTSIQPEEEHIKWSKEEKLALMKLWHRIYDGTRNNNGKKILLEWKRERPKSNKTEEQLRSKANALLKRGFIIPAEYNEGVPIHLDLSVKEQRNKTAKSKLTIFQSSHLNSRNKKQTDIRRSFKKSLQDFAPKLHFEDSNQSDLEQIQNFIPNQNNKKSNQTSNSGAAHSHKIANKPQLHHEDYIQNHSTSESIIQTPTLSQESPAQHQSQMQSQKFHPELFLGGNSIPPISPFLSSLLNDHNFNQSKD